MISLAFALAACTPQALPLTVSAIPWPDSEQTTYTIEDQQGNTVGSCQMIVEKEDDTYLLTQNYDLWEWHMTDEINMRVNADTLKPISESRIMDTAQGRIEVTTSYSDNKLTINAITPDGEQSAEMDVPADAYDNDEVLFLYRALPFEIGYTASYTNIVAASALKPRVTISVTGQEMVETPAGSFDAYKLELEAAGATQYMWYAVETPHYLIKYDNGVTIFLLTEHP